MAKIMLYSWKAALVVAGAMAAGALARLLGPWAGFAAWAALAGAACAAAAVLLKGAPAGRITWRNRLAGYLLPWGYRLGRGKLGPITFAAWAIWVLIGAASVLLAARGGLLPRPAGVSAAAPPATSPAHPTQTDAAPRPVVAALLFGTWVIYGALVLRQLGSVLNEFRSPAHGRRTMLNLTALLLALVGVSVVLWLAGLPGLALLAAGGPLALVGGGYGLFIGAVLIFGRNARWN